MADHIKDLHRLPEDERVRIVGELASEGKTVDVILEPDQVARFIQKVITRYPTVCVLGRLANLQSMLVTVKFGRMST